MNVSTMSRDALVAELLATTTYAPASWTSTVSQGVHEAVLPFDVPRETHLNHILGIAKELLMRDLRRELRHQPLIPCPQALRDWLRIYCANLEHEVFLVIFLDVHCRLLDVETMFRGTLTQTSVYPREVVKAALARNASAVAFAHNHPSGVTDPSRADEMLTQNLKAALALVDVRVVDHCIIAADQLLSMAEQGLL